MSDCRPALGRLELFGLLDAGDQKIARAIEEVFEVVGEQVSVKPRERAIASGQSLAAV